MASTERANEQGKGDEAGPLPIRRLAGSVGSRWSGPTRRQIVQAGIASLFLPGVARALAGPQKFRIEETAGIRRFGYPVRVVLPGANPNADFELLQGGKRVAAQFRTVRAGGGQGAVVLDFNASPGPFEAQSYVINPIAADTSKVEPKQGMRAEQADAVFRVSNGSLLTFAVPKNLEGLLAGVKTPQCDFVVPEKEGGLWIRGKDETITRVSGSASNARQATVSVQREGPLAVGLNVETDQKLAGDQVVRSLMEITFPSSKSWVELSWRIDDDGANVAGMGLDLHLRLSGNTTLVDLGASSTVYGQLKGAEHMELIAGRAAGLLNPVRPWMVLKGEPKRMMPYAEAPRRYSPSAEGWAHVMDNACCTAAAVADFGRSSRDSIDVDAAGWLRIRRDFAVSGAPPPQGPKTLVLWLHFVTMPVQVGAATSPQAMLSPLKLVWE